MKEYEKIILSKMKTYAMQAIEYKGNLDFDEFSKDAKTIAACVFNLSQIGELVSRLDAKFTEANTNIPWHSVKGMRNRIVHDYEGIKLSIVWDVLVDFLPELVRNINNILSDE